MKAIKIQKKISINFVDGEQDQGRNFKNFLTNFLRFLVSGFTMLDTPVPIQTLKLSNIGPG
jgi:hypothetical protein